MDTSDPSTWTCSSQEVLNIHIAEPDRAVSFPPKFTYPIFGDSEQIFGYKDLKIDLAFDCLSLKPLLTYKYSSKLNDEIKSIESIIGPFLPQKDYILKSEEKWLDAIDSENFVLPKEKIVFRYERQGDAYDIYKFSLVDDPVGLKLHLRMQIFVLLYIEAGSYITCEDPQWELYVIYKTSKDDVKPTFVGFATTYRHFHYEGAQIHDERNFEDLRFKNKISQFIILPPFQRQGHGKKLYNYLFDKWLGDERCVEVTVEDPSEDFDELRDHCDLVRLIQSGSLDEIREFPVADIGSVVTNTKLVKRQLNRCVEMGLAWKLANNYNDIKGLNEKNLRLMIKKRVYLSNKDALDELEDPDRNDKLETTYRRVRDHYGDFVQSIAVGTKRKHD